MIKLIITDIGGVLVKTDEAIITCIERVFREQSVPLGNREDLLDAFGVSLYDYILNYLPEEHKEKVDLLYREFQKIYPAEAVDLMQVFEGVNETLKILQLRDFKISVLSCMKREEVDVNLSLLSFNDFNLVFSLEDYEFKRPDPTGLQKIMEKLGVLPEETLYIGDSVNDVKMAKNAGVLSVAVATGAQDSDLILKEEPDYFLAAFWELLSVVEELR